jgi:DNA ligase-1
MSEKMDGVRAYWDGNKLISKQSKEFPCPKWFIEGLPKGVKLDGEIWIKRGKFEDVVTTVKSSDAPLWKDIKFVLFDMLLPQTTYEDRMDQLKKLQLPPFVSVVQFEKCLGNEQLVKSLETVVKDGGEGFILTKPGSLYESGRTRTRLKVKVNIDCF